MVNTLPATIIGQRVIADARNASSSRQENLQEVDKYLTDLAELGEASLDKLEKMQLVYEQATPFAFLCMYIKMIYGLLVLYMLLESIEHPHQSDQVIYIYIYICYQYETRDT